MNPNDSLIVKIVEDIEGNKQAPPERYEELYFLPDWGYWRWFYLKYGERLTDLQIDWDAETVTITPSVAQSELEIALLRIIDGHAAAAADPVAAACAALHRMFPEPSA